MLPLTLYVGKNVLEFFFYLEKKNKNKQKMDAAMQHWLSWNLICRTDWP